MKVVDTNVLLYAVNPDAEHHRAAHSWLDRMLSGAAPVGFAWTAVMGFIRVSTLPRLFDRPLTAEEAFDFVERWMTSRTAQVVTPGSGHLTIMRSLLGDHPQAGNLVNDAHLAALAVEHKATVVTFDADFGRFPGVRWERPTLT